MYTEQKTFLRTRICFFV